jgi:hypothetical protein
LFNTGKAIQQAQVAEHRADVSEEMLRAIAEVYFEYYKHQKQQNFHGLSHLVTFIILLSSC